MVVNSTLFSLNCFEDGLVTLNKVATYIKKEIVKTIIPNIIYKCTFSAGVLDAHIFLSKKSLIPLTPYPMIIYSVISKASPTRVVNTKHRGGISNRHITYNLIPAGINNNLARIAATQTFSSTFILITLKYILLHNIFLHFFLTVGIYMKKNILKFVMSPVKYKIINKTDESSTTLVTTIIYNI